MANIQERRNKEGKLISYSIRVHRGRDAEGKQLKPYSTTFEVPEGWSEVRAKKEAEKEAVLFEEKCKTGMAVDNRQTFEQYANYVIGMKEKRLKRRSYERDRELLKRILPAIGHMKLSDIRPQHLNNFYDNLSEKGLRQDTKYLCSFDIRKTIAKKKMTKKAFSELAGVSVQVIDSIEAGKNVSLKSAEAISKALNKPIKALFDEVNKEERLSNNTISGYHKLISSILAQAEKEMLIPYNPAHKASPPKVVQKQANHFQIEDVQAIINRLEDEPIKWKTITHLLMVTGCRRGEILGLKWNKVDLDKGTLRIDNNLLYSKEVGIYEDTTKTHKSRVVSIPPEVVKLLKEYRKWYLSEKIANGDRWIKSDYVFVREDGRVMHPDSITAWLGKFAERHGIKHINPHAFRHTYASILISKGVDIVTVSKQLGHEKVSTTTDIYAELMKQASEEASETIANVMFRGAK